MVIGMMMSDRRDASVFPCILYRVGKSGGGEAVLAMHYEEIQGDKSKCP